MAYAGTFPRALPEPYAIARLRGSQSPLVGMAVAFSLMAAAGLSSISRN